MAGAGGTSGDAGSSADAAPAEDGPPAAGEDAGPTPADAGSPPPPGTALVLEDPLPCMHMVAVAGSAALAPALSAAKPGDCLVPAAGDYAFPAVTPPGR